MCPVNQIEKLLKKMHDPRDLSLVADILKSACMLCGDHDTQAMSSILFKAALMADRRAADLVEIEACSAGEQLTIEGC